MSEKYKISEQDRPYFITITTVGWIDVFTRKELKLIILDSLKYCQQNKGLAIFGWCLMPSHLHLICQACKNNHNNQVEEMIVEKPEDYLFSSARNYADLSGLLEIVMETRKVKSY